MSETTALASLNARLNAGETIVLDGATGSEMERRGAKVNEGAWCAMTNLEHTDLLVGLHEDYIRAGVDLITTNTFSTNRNMMDPAGLGAHCTSAIRAAVGAACRARENMDAGHVVVAGSMSHQVPMDKARNRFVPPEAQARANFSEMADLLAEEGVDLILLEMMSDPFLVNLAFEAALNTGLPTWIGFSTRVNDAGDAESYSVANLSVEAMLDAIDFDRAAIAGIMHTKVHAVRRSLPILKARWDGPLMVYPDSGFFQKPHWQFVDILPIPDFVAHCEEWHADGVNILGACCGMGVEHIEALVASVRATPTN